MWPIVSIDRQVVDKSNEYVSAFLSSGYLIQLLYVMTWVYMISPPPLVVKLSAATLERDKNVRSEKKVENSCEQKMDNTKTSMLTCELNYAPSIHCGKKSALFLWFLQDT